MKAFIAIPLLVTLAAFALAVKDLGKLDCTEKEGLKPDSKLINVVVSKCQPKTGQSVETTAACLIKCLMKQHKAVDKKGQLKKEEGKALCNLFPENMRANVTAQYEKCHADHASHLKKEPNGCETWKNFTGCFYDFGKSLCPTEKEREAMATSTALPSS